MQPEGQRQRRGAGRRQVQYGAVRRGGGWPQGTGLGRRVLLLLRAGMGMQRAGRARPPLPYPAAALGQAASFPSPLSPEGCMPPHLLPLRTSWCWGSVSRRAAMQATLPDMAA